MTQWEYTQTEAERGGTTTVLNAFGEAGWELVTVISRPGLPERAIFKRPLATNGRITATKKGVKR